jgi:hypothetical protein
MLSNVRACDFKLNVTVLYQFIVDFRIVEQLSGKGRGK